MGYATLTHPTNASSSFFKQRSRHTSSFSRHDMSELCILSSPRAKQRAQGTPDAGRTREPCVQKKCTFTHASSTGQPDNPAFPAQWFTACFALSPVTGFLATVTSPMSPPAKLGASIGAPGPHDFAVRGIGRSSSPSPRPPHPTARIVTCATPLVSGETGEFVQLICPTAKAEFCPSGYFVAVRFDSQRDEIVARMSAAICGIGPRMSLRSSGLRSACVQMRFGKYVT